MIPVTDYTFVQKIEFSLNVINHILISFVTIYLSWMCIRLSLHKTALHAWLCTIGYNLLMVEGIMCYYSGNVLTYTATRNTKTTIHWILMSLGGTLGIVGAIVKIAEKPIHFQTYHGITGLAATILCGLSLITGVSALFAQNLSSYCGYMPILNKGIHNFLGLSSFVIGMVAQYYGYETGFFKRKVEPDFAIMMQVFTIIIIILSCPSAIRTVISKLLYFRSYV